MEDIIAIIKGIAPETWVLVIIVTVLFVFFVGSLAHWLYSEYEYRKLVGKRTK